MTWHKSLKLISSIMIAGLVLAGCGAHHSKSMNYAAHTASEEVSHKSRHHRRATKPVHKIQHSLKNINKGSQANIKSSQKLNTSDYSNRTSVQSNQQANQNDTQSVQTDILPKVNLGHGVIGVEDRGAGQIYIGFNVNGQHFVSHGSDVNEPSDSALNNARGIVNNLVK